MHCALVSEYFSFLNARSQTLYPTAYIQRSSGSGLYFQNVVSLGTYVERPDPGKIAGNLVARSAVRMRAAEWQAAMVDLAPCGDDRRANDGPTHPHHAQS